MAEFDPATIAEYTEAGAWDATTIADMVAANALADPGGTAFVAPDANLTWRAYDELSTRLAGALTLAGWRPGEVLGVLLPGGALTHVTYLAAQKAGLVTFGLGVRSGDAEITHLLRHCAARALGTRPSHRGRAGAEIAERVGAGHLELDLADREASAPVLSARWAGRPLALPDVDAAAAAVAGRGLGADDLFFLNSTSGTTGLPKVVRQTMNIRQYFAPLAAQAADFGPDEVVASLVPAPYGFGLWSGHITPARYGYPTVLTEQFDPAASLRLIERHKVTVLAAVTSQFVMMMNSPEFAAADLSTLRVLFTGGERVPFDRAAQFEDRTGATVLQFYGSTEAGPVSVTRVTDDRTHRLRTSGRPIPDMRLRLFRADGQDVTAGGGPGQVAVRGPGCVPGYFRDEAADRVLFRPDGWLLTGDIGRIDEDGYLSLTGRVADFIIRGGFNISALVVEEAVGSHPRVAQVAVVGVPDDLLGERVCAYVVTRDGGELSLEDLRAHLDAAGVSKHNWPERLVCRPALSLSSGGKVDKAALREDARRRFPATGY